MISHFSDFFASSPSTAWLSLLESHSDLVMYVLERGEAGWSTVFVSQNVGAVLGYAPEACLRSGWWAAGLHPDDRDRVFGAQSELRLHGVLRHEYRFRHAHGHDVWVRDSLKLVVDEAGREYVVGTWSDITAQMRTSDLEAQLSETRRMQEALAASEARYRLMAENASDIIAVLGGDGRIRFISPSAEAVLGRGPEALTGMVAFDMVHPDDRAQVAAMFERMLAAPEPVSLRYRIVRPDGEERWVETNAVRSWGSVQDLEVHLVARDITRRHEAEQALIESEARFRMLAEHATDVVGVLEPDGTISYASPAAERVLGWPAEVLVGRNIATLLQAQDGGDVLGLLANDRPLGEPLTICHAVQHGQGHTVWLETVSRRVPYGDGSWRVHTVTRDVSARRAYEMEMRRDRMRLHHIVQATSDMICILTPEGGLTYMNRAFRAAVGLDDELPSRLEAHLEPEAAACLVTEILPAAEREGSWTGESAIVDAHGEAVPVSVVLTAHYNEAGKLEYHSAICRDIRDRKRAEAALRKRTQELTEAQRLAKIARWEIDLQSGLIQWADDHHLFAHLPPAPAGLPAAALSEIVHPEDLAHVTRAFEQALAEGLPYRVDYRTLGPHGEVAHLHSEGELTTGADGQVKLVGYTQDVSERHAVERMKSEFVSVVSHELRTPLTAIHGALSLLHSGVVGQVPPAAQQMLNIATTSSARLVRLINDILDLERIESGKGRHAPRPCAADELTTRAVEGIAAIAEEAGVALEAVPTAVMAHADPDQLIQALTNLLANAIKFSPAGSTVRVGAAREGAFVRFSVADTGRGIPADQLESIFDRFTQVDATDARVKGGSGLGLAISRSIVEQHGGRIWAESELGVGSTFHFTVPAGP